MESIELPRGGVRSEEASELFRMWLAHYCDWQPKHWSDTPPVAIAIEPVEAATYSAEQARSFLEGFNSQMLLSERRLWAVAVPVALRFEGDARPGDPVRGHVFDEFPQEPAQLK